MFHRYFRLSTLSALLLIGALRIVAIGEGLPAAPISNDEGGVRSITGQVTYDDPNFTLGDSEPLIILEDQTGFVLRDKGYDIPVASQALAQITSDFRVSPFTYSLALPLEPQGTLHNFNPGGGGAGVMVFAVAYWSNTFGDAYLEERDLFGGGWSGAYASTFVSGSTATEGEYLGGRILIYAPEAGQAFPTGFGADAKLFTADDPLVLVPAGYTLVDMDTPTFTFDRAARQTVDLLQGDFSIDDFSQMGYTEAFDAMIEMFRTRYAFTEYKGIDWDAVIAEYRPRFVAAEAANDPTAYALALRDLNLSIPDGHVSLPWFQQLNDTFRAETDGGLGFAIGRLDDGRFVVRYVTPDSPATENGIELLATIESINGVPTQQWVDETRIWVSEASPHFGDLQRARYSTRFEVGEQVEVTFRNPGASTSQTVTLEAVPERQSFSATSFNRGRTGLELPVEFDVLPDGYLYTAIYSFSDDNRLGVLLWERALRVAIDNQLPGLIVDMRLNGGGNAFVAQAMVGYFQDQGYTFGQSASYDDASGEFTLSSVPRTIVLSPEDLRYTGEVVVLVGPNCASACEIFSWAASLGGRAAIVGMYPTSGMGGSIRGFYMPGGAYAQYTIARTLDMEGNIAFEGLGIAPTVVIPATEQTIVVNDSDPVLDGAVQYLNEKLGQ